MIAYMLACQAGHEFEAWFRNSKAFEEQSAARLVTCPVCGDSKVHKAIMAPAVKGSTTKAKGANAPLSPAERQKLRQFMTGYRKFIEENAEYVGRRFPEEARKIHYGESDERHIYGESTLAEAKQLIEEGVDVAPMPPDPDDLN